MKTFYAFALLFFVCVASRSLFAEDTDPNWLLTVIADNYARKHANRQHFSASQEASERDRHEEHIETSASKSTKDESAADGISSPWTPEKIYVSEVKQVIPMFKTIGKQTTATENSEQMTPEVLEALLGIAFLYDKDATNFYFSLQAHDESSIGSPSPFAKIDAPLNARLSEMGGIFFRIVSESSDGNGYYLRYIRKDHNIAKALAIGGDLFKTSDAIERQMAALRNIAEQFEAREKETRLIVQGLLNNSAKNKLSDQKIRFLSMLSSAALFRESQWRQIKHTCKTSLNAPITLYLLYEEIARIYSRVRMLTFHRFVNDRGAKTWKIADADELLQISYRADVEFEYISHLHSIHDDVRDGAYRILEVLHPYAKQTRESLGLSLELPKRMRSYLHEEAMVSKNMDDSCMELAASSDEDTEEPESEKETLKKPQTTTTQDSEPTQDKEKTTTLVTHQYTFGSSSSKKSNAKSSVTRKRIALKAHIEDDTDRKELYSTLGGDHQQMLRNLFSNGKRAYDRVYRLESLTTFVNQLASKLARLSITSGDQLIDELKQRKHTFHDGRGKESKLPANFVDILRLSVLLPLGVYPPDWKPQKSSEREALEKYTSKLAQSVKDKKSLDDNMAQLN